MSTIGGVPTAGTGGAVIAPAPGAGGGVGPSATTTAPAALSAPGLAAHGAALAGVLAGTGKLGLGASGAHVRAIQEALALATGTAPAATGTFDRETERAVSLLQRRLGLTPTGEVDQATLVAIDKAAAAAAPAAPSGADPLAGVPHMDRTTFATMPQYVWDRDGVELESVNGVRGMDPVALLEALRATNDAGRTLFQRIRRPEAAEAFTLGYEGGGIDDMRWDADSHRLRESLDFVSITVEGGRAEIDPRTGERAVSLGTDIMDDTYYDTEGFDLLENSFSVRGRARWDDATTVRRLLVGVKANTSVDDLDIKRTEKTDIRRDGASPEEVADLDRAVRSGRTRWGGREEPIPPLKAVYDALAAKGVLPDVGTHEDVLLLEPKVHVRSVRSRYHMNETPIESVRALHREGGAGRIRHALELAGAAKARPDVTAAERAAIEALERAGHELLALPELPARPSWGGARVTFEELEKDRLLAESIDEKYHAFAQGLDGVRRVISGARSQDLEDAARLFVGWQRTADPALQGKGAFDPFLAKYDGMQDADRLAFNAYGEAQRAAGDRAFRRFSPLDEQGWKALRPALMNEVVRIHTRQIEAAGSAARTLWFDEARAFYVPESTRQTGNFLIDSFDMSEYVKHEDWESIPESERTPACAIPLDKVFHASLVSEVQIELGLEKPYLERLRALKDEIDRDRASLVMKWLTASGAPGVVPGDASTYGAALERLGALGDAELAAELARLNEFLRAQGSALRPLEAGDLRGLGAALLTLENRDRPVRTDPGVERNFEGARFVFERYTGTQKFLAGTRTDRVVRMLRDAGAPPTMTFEPTDGAKGDTAMKILAGIP